MTPTPDTLAKKLDELAEYYKSGGPDSNHKGGGITIGEIRAAAAALRRAQGMEEALREIRTVWEQAEDACDGGGFIEDHIPRSVAEYTDNENFEQPRHLLCDFVEKVGRKARAALGSDQ